MTKFNDEIRERLARLSTTNLSDAMDALSLKGATYGIVPMWYTMTKVVGPAVTIRMANAGEMKSKHHLGVTAIDAANPGPACWRISWACMVGRMATPVRQDPAFRNDAFPVLGRCGSGCSVLPCPPP